MKLVFRNECLGVFVSLFCRRNLTSKAVFSKSLVPFELPSAGCIANVVASFGVVHTGSQWTCIRRTGE